MSILWNEFTPWASLAGGLLIGLSAALLIALLGRVAGISSITGALLQMPTWAIIAKARKFHISAIPLKWQRSWPQPLIRKATKT